MDSGRNALIFFFAVFWSAAIASVVRYRAFETTALFKRGAWGRVWRRMIMGILFLNILPIGMLWFLYDRMPNTPLNTSGLAEVVVAACCSLSIFSLARIFHAFVCSDGTYKLFYTEKEMKDVVRAWNPNDFPVSNKFVAHFLPGLAFLVGWPALAALIWHYFGKP